jgi:hypothetical protein
MQFGRSPVLEDDAVPVDGWRERVAAAWAVAPTPLASLYLGTWHPRYTQARIKSATARTTRIRLSPSISSAECRMTGRRSKR